MSTSSSTQQVGLSSSAHEAIARAWVDAMAAGDASKGTPPLLSADMKKGFAPAKADAVWTAITKGKGAFRGIGGARTEALGEGREVVFVEGRFEAGAVTFAVSFDTTSHEVIGFRIPPPAKPSAPAPHLQ